MARKKARSLIYFNRSIYLTLVQDRLLFKYWFYTITKYSSAIFQAIMVVQARLTQLSQRTIIHMSLSAWESGVVEISREVYCTHIRNSSKCHSLSSNHQGPRPSSSLCNSRYVHRLHIQDSLWATSEHPRNSVMLYMEDISYIIEFLS